MLAFNVRDWGMEDWDDLPESTKEKLVKDYEESEARKRKELREWAEKQKTKETLEENKQETHSDVQNSLKT